MPDRKHCALSMTSDRGVAARLAEISCFSLALFGLAGCAGEAGGGSIPDTDASESLGADTSTPSGTHASVTSGYGHTCAADTAGTITCWGANDYGQISDTPDRQEAP